MNNSMIKKSLLATALLVAAHGALAASPTSVINVSGKITTQTCTVASSDVNKTVALTPNGDSQLQNATNLLPVAFSFGISGCDSSLTKATATVGGTTASSDVTGYGTSAVIANTGTATNVGIGFLGATSVSSTPAGVLPVGTASAVATLAKVGSATTTSGTLYLGAQIVPLVKATLPTAGTVAGTATVTFTYS
ncbi:type 1 fimbrial protein [Kosakonia sp. H7A]|uniref:fimbrial protein n=1 Tax=Kosakonia sp. H7A TaxID=2054598 RepID=UPI000D16B1C9|nr:type 1 fimbrial protein [Kosakonia sp. H7A]PTA88964.1 type 1 fimbrial protein [Kosakonia sp. H7A]